MTLPRQNRMERRTMNTLCVVLVAPEDEVSFRWVREMLRPYDARLPVEPYEEECWCVNAQAFADASSATEDTLYNLDPDRYLRIARLERPDPENDFTAEEWREIEQHEAHFEAMRERLEKAHPLRNKPSPDCEDCGGSGVVEGFENPIAEFGEWQPAQRFESKFRVPVRELLRDIDKYQVWAVVTPQGTWYARPSAGHKERESSEGYERRDALVLQQWEPELKAILRANEDCTAMSVEFYPYD